MEADTRPRRRRLDPQERRREILDAARSVFAHRERATVTLADVARAAGVDRTLVHHYFGTVDRLHAEVAAAMAAEIAGVRRAGPEVPLAERAVVNTAGFLDLVEANRELYLATASRGGNDALLTEIVEVNVGHMLHANADLIDDTPFTRFALRAYASLVTGACLQWLAGEASREDVARLLNPTFIHLVASTLAR